MEAATANKPARRFLFIANGNGEDSIAAEIVRRLPASIKADAYPIIGPGRAFDDLCSIVGPRAHIPSEGWRHQSGSVAGDIKGGMLSTIPPAIGFLKSVRIKYDRVIVVGDMVGPLFCLLAGLPVDIYLDVFKSGYSHHYGWLERTVIRRIAKKTYCRDTMLAEALARTGISAVSAGNIMLDCVQRGDYEMAARRKHPLTVTLLPGSRVWTGESLTLQIAALKKLSPDVWPDVFVGLAEGLDSVQLAAETGMTFEPPHSGEAADAGTLTDDGLVLHMARGVLGNLIEGANVVLSQAGTATQQALGLGRPVVTFNRRGNRPKRMRDEQALMGDARILTPPDAVSLAQETERLLRDADLRRKLGQIGRMRLGGPGTIATVLAELDVEPEI